MRARFEVFPVGYAPAEDEATEQPPSGWTPAEWRWRLVAANGEIVAQSEGYTRRADAERGARDARRAARLAKVEAG